MIRTIFEKEDKMRDKVLNTPEDIIRKDDIVYGQNK